MLFMGTHTFPLEKSVAVGQLTVKALPTLPPYIKINSFVNMGGDGLMVWTIWEVEKGHEDEGLLFIMKHRMQHANIGGQKFTLEPVLTGADALRLLGLSL